ncbi:MAG: phosphatidylserine decarboxylase [Alphaproteobacteria bacterium]|nr:phosphatidylserine decarboxylase [Alphaproteobacteria bacterium]
MNSFFPIPPIHRAGWVFIAGFAAATGLISFLGWPFFVFGSVFTLWCAYFFRDPARHTPVRAGLLVSPGDGRVVKIEPARPPAALGMEGERARISIFLSVFDVHINRIPADGTVEAEDYHFGKFLHAAHDKASEDNERNALRITLAGDHAGAGRDIAVVQIAGYIARRIVCDVKVGQAVKAGERYGLIRFGSRVDLYLPQGMAPLVAVGQYVLGGETVLADCAGTEPARMAEER